MGQYAVRTFGPVAYANGGYLVEIGGLPVTIVAGSLQVQRTVGKRATASFVVKLPDTSVHYQQWQQVSIFDASTTLGFSGYITNPIEARPSYKQSLLCTIQCCDQHYLADKRRWAATYTNKTCGYIVHDLINNVLSQEGVTVGAIFDGLTPGSSLYPGPTLFPGNGAGLIAQANFTYDKTVAQILDDLTAAASSGGVPFYWMIDQFKRLWFVPYTYVVNNTLVDGSQIEAVQQPPTVERKNDLYRNTQYVMGGVAQTAQQTETRMGDGNTRSWVMGYAMAGAPTITKNGSSQTVGVKGATGKQFYYQVGDPTITQDSGQTVLSSSDTLQVVYTGQYPNIAISQNAAQVSYMALIDGSSGIVELATTDNTLTSASNALSEASTLLTRYGAQGILLTFVTKNTGYAPGQLITVNLPTFGLNTTQMLIEQVDASDQQDGYTIWYTVKAVSGPYDQSWVDFFSSLLRAPTQAITINASTTQTTQIAQVFTGSVSPTASYTASVYACPLPSVSLFPSTSLLPC